MTPPALTPDPAPGATKKAGASAAAVQLHLTRRRLVRGTTGIAAVAVVPLQAACSPVAANERYLIAMTADNRFEPGGVTIPLGATVVWQNADTTRHTSTCEPSLAANPSHMALPAGAVPWNSGDLYTGQAWQRTFTAAGIYLYFCRYHAGAGMLGSITVVAHHDAAQPTNP